jgi:tetrapyrrole methylase family protein/MazG family protein
MTPRIDVVGLGPAGPGLVTAESLELLRRAQAVILRTGDHPSAELAREARTFDHHYEEGGTLDSVYTCMADDLVAEAKRVGSVVYAVPGSPTVAESSVAELTGHPTVLAGEVTVHIHPAVSFVDVACARLGVDPVAAGVRLVDGVSSAADAAGERGPLLVAQCWSRGVLSGIKLAVEAADPPAVTVLWHLGLDDERLWELEWVDLDRSFDPDHLTSLWIPQLVSPVAVELVRLDELVRTLRERCPWDREQTHGSLARHLLEESYEVLEAIDAVAAADSADSRPGGGAAGDGSHDADSQGGPGGGGRAVAHLEEELGDLLFQVYFHARLAAEAGRFTLADVARGVHDKLVSRHPHVFGDGWADTPAEVMANWEVRKLAEKNRSSVTQGIPHALPALALAAKLQRKALAVGMALPSVADEAVRVAEGVARLETAAGDGPTGRHGVDGEGGRAEQAAELGALLFSVVNVARSLGVDPETALRARDAAFRRSVEAHG